MMVNVVFEKLQPEVSNFFVYTSYRVVYRVRWAYPCIVQTHSLKLSYLHFLVAQESRLMIMEVLYLSFFFRIMRQNWEGIVGPIE